MLVTRFACPSWRCMTTSGTPSRAISSATVAAGPLRGGDCIPNHFTRTVPAVPAFRWPYGRLPVAPIAPEPLFTEISAGIHPVIGAATIGPSARARSLWRLVIVRTTAIVRPAAMMDVTSVAMSSA